MLPRSRTVSPAHWLFLFFFKFFVTFMRTVLGLAQRHLLRSTVPSTGNSTYCTGDGLSIN